MDIITFLKKESFLWKKGIERVNNRKSVWPDFENKAKTQFNSIITEAKTQKLFDVLYLHSSGDVHDSHKITNFITLFWGQHPTGGYEFEGERKGRMVFERGCALHLCQLPTGEVIATFYPYQSALLKSPKNYYVYKVYSSPSKITDADIQWLVRIMFSLARSSSFARKMTFFDYYILWWLKTRTLFRDAWHRDWTNAIMQKLSKVLDTKIDDIIKSNDSKANGVND